MSKQRHKGILIRQSHHNLAYLATLLRQQMSIRYSIEREAFGYHWLDLPFFYQRHHAVDTGKSLVPIILQLTEWAQNNMKTIIEHRKNNP